MTVLKTLCPHLGAQIIPVSKNQPPKYGIQSVMSYAPSGLSSAAICPRPTSSIVFSLQHASVRCFLLNRLEAGAFLTRSTQCFHWFWTWFHLQHWYWSSSPKRFVFFLYRGPPHCGGSFDWILTDWKESPKGTWTEPWVAWNTLLRECMYLHSRAAPLNRSSKSLPSSRWRNTLQRLSSRGR